MAEKTIDEMVQQQVEHYLESHLRIITTDSFTYKTYTAPNTMVNSYYKMSEVMLAMPYLSLKCWLRTIGMLKQSNDLVKAVTVNVSYENYKDIISKNRYRISMNWLKIQGFLIATKKRDVMIVNLDYYNMLSNPKLTHEESNYYIDPRPLSF